MSQGAGKQILKDGSEAKRDLPSISFDAAAMGSSKQPVAPATPVAESSKAEGKIVAESGNEELTDFELIKKFTEFRRKTVAALKKSKSESQRGELDIDEMIDGMTCVDCGRVPSPQRRFLCARGHHFCWQCGRGHFRLDKDGVGTGVCLKPGEAWDIARPIRGVGYGSIHPKAQLDDNEIEDWVKNKRTGNTECRLFLRKGHSDPLYLALFNNSKWDCPVKIAGCNKTVTGVDSQKHIPDCLRKHGIV